MQGIVCRPLSLHPFLEQASVVIHYR